MGARNITSFKQHQEGAVLVITLIILVIVTIISVMGMRSGILELRMSSNEEQRTMALQIAQSALDQITERVDNFRVLGTVDGSAINCTSSVTTTCLSTTLTLSGAAFNFPDYDGDGNPDLNVKALIRRIPPNIGNPPRVRGKEFDVGKFRSVYFQVESEYNSSGSTAGHAMLYQGQLVLIPSGG